MSFIVTWRSLFIAKLWVTGIAVAVFDAFWAPPLAAVAIAFMVGAATLSVLGRIDKYAANWETAYGAGREVTQLRQRR